MKRGGAILFLLGIGGVAFLAYSLSKNKRLSPNVIPNSITSANRTILQMTAPGIRNNNPLNIEYSTRNNWVGQTGSDGRFAKFVDIEHGFRAAYIDLSNKLKRGLNTVAAIVSTWAPASDGNDTATYIKNVSRRMNVLEFTPLSQSDLPRLIQAMAIQEVGKEYPMSTIMAGVKLV